MGVEFVLAAWALTQLARRWNRQDAAGANGKRGFPEDQLAHLRTYIGIIHR